MSACTALRENHIKIIIIRMYMNKESTHVDHNLFENPLPCKILYTNLLKIDIMFGVIYMDTVCFLYFLTGQSNIYFFVVCRLHGAGLLNIGGKSHLKIQL